MEDMLTRISENLIARTEGPMNLRFIIQPMLSLIFAVRAGINDTRYGIPPYLWRFLVSKDDKRIIAREGWKDIGRIFVTGIILDLVYQIIIVYGIGSESRFSPLESLMVAACLAIFPYLLLRGPIGRVSYMIYQVRRRQTRKPPGDQKPSSVTRPPLKSPSDASQRYVPRREPSSRL